jgi:transcription elongation GreA/GreB family factor
MNGDPLDELNEQGAEITRLRAENATLKEAIRRLAEQDATLSLLCKRDGSQVVTVTMDATLTDDEREAVEWAANAADPYYTGHTATLRGLLERLA